MLKRIYSLYIFLNVLTTVSSLNIQTNINNIISEAQKDEVNFFLYGDEFFNHFGDNGYIGNGTNGTVLNLSYLGTMEDKFCVLKITNPYELTYHNSIVTEDNLKMNYELVNPSSTNYIISKYLRQHRVPFIMDTYGIRHVLFHRFEENNSSDKDSIEEIKINTSDNHDSENSEDNKDYVLVSLQVSSFAEHGELIAYHKLFPTATTEILTTEILEIVYKSAFALNEMNKLKILHADLKSDNIFIQKCQFDNAQYCPMIGDFDSALYIGDQETNEKLGSCILVRHNRPPELNYFCYNHTSEILIGPGGYSFSGKEIVYAFGIVFADLFRLNKIDPTAEIKSIIDRMIYPVTFDSMCKNKNGQDWMNYFKDLKTNTANQINPEFKEKKEKLDNICSGLFNELDLNEGEKEMLEYEAASGFSSISKFSMVWIKMKEMKDSRKFLEDNLSSEELGLFDQYVSELRQIQPFPEIIENRITMKEALIEIAKLVHGSEIPVDIDTFLVNQLAAYQQEFDQVDIEIIQDTEFNKVYVSEDVFEISNESVKEICKDFDQIDKGYPIEYETKLEFEKDEEDEEKKLLTVSDLCRQLLAKAEEMTGEQFQEIEAVQTGLDFII